MLDVSRIEQKYPMTPVQAAQVEERLRLFMKPDSHNGPGGYQVRSVYFDTPFNTDYRDKENGEYCRRKLRLRVYGQNAAAAKLELKEKLGPYQRKRSLEVARPQAEALLRGEYAFLEQREEAFAQELYCLMATQVYRPKILVCYRRKAFYLEENDTRVTFDDCLTGDMDVRKLFSGLPSVPVAGGGWLTLEVKFRDYLQSNVKLALGQSIRVQESIGKYSLCRQALPR